MSKKGARVSARSAPRRKQARSASQPESAPRPGPRWTFLSNHAHVLICLAREPHVRLREVAVLIGITERAVQKILADLEKEGLVERHREGRRNSYDLHLEQPLRHPLEAHREVGELVALIVED